MLGLYVHIPFCKRKCGYCDFYSQVFDKDTARTYISAVKSRLYGINKTFDTVYFGGGTPSILQDGVADILSAIKTTECAEITAECNPDSATDLFLCSAAKAGVNRLSIGLQSANEGELIKLTRPHTAADVISAVKRARSFGIENISLDIMFGFEGQTVASLKNTIDFCAQLGVNHISAYMLKVEPNTPFNKISGICVDDDSMASLYESCCERLNFHGYEQYEISNFAKGGYICKHNMIYWNCDDYIGIGPAAHSLYRGKRYHYERDINSFLNGYEPICDGCADLTEEYIMLRLRLNDGLYFEELEKRGLCLPDGFYEKCKNLEKAGLMIFDSQHAALTRKGFLVQNSILTYIL